MMGNCDWCNENAHLFAQATDANTSLASENERLRRKLATARGALFVARHRLRQWGMECLRERMENDHLRARVAELETQVKCHKVVADKAMQDWREVSAELDKALDNVDMLRARVAELEETLKLTRGAMDAQDRREREAGEKCRVDYDQWGCDWPDAAADKILWVRKQRDDARKRVAELEVAHAEAMAVVLNNEGLLERTIRERDEAREQRDRNHAAWWELEKNRCREHLTAGGGAS